MMFQGEMIRQIAWTMKAKVNWCLAPVWQALISTWLDLIRIQSTGKTKQNKNKTATQLGHLYPTKCLCLNIAFRSQKVNQTLFVSICSSHRSWSPAAEGCHQAEHASVFTGVNLLSLGALLAFHVAAPTDLALAWPSDHPALRIVPSPTADAVTVLVFVTFPSWSPGWVSAHQTKAWGIVNVDKIRSPWDLITVTRDGFLGRGNVSFPRGLVGSAAHFERRLVLLLQLLPYFVEWRKLPPARSDGAGPRHTVALTGCFHTSFDDLQTHTSPKEYQLWGKKSKHRAKKQNKTKHNSPKTFVRRLLEHRADDNTKNICWTKTENTQHSCVEMTPARILLYMGS